jgi:hypothetical protein
LTHGGKSKAASQQQTSATRLLLLISNSKGLMPGDVFPFAPLIPLATSSRGNFRAAI